MAVWWLAAIVVGTCPAPGLAQSELTGEQIFAGRCARCHGPVGEGTADNPKQLAGDLSVDQLAAVISETMPEDDPGTLRPAESQAVAAFIHETFYSPIAQARNKPARIELARLTVRQYRQALADLFGSFLGRSEWDDERGLRGEYFASREPQGRDSAKVQRTDSTVDFDFKTEAPVPEIDEPRVYSIRWTGSVMAPDTGDYEFIIRTDHAFRLWINGSSQPLIDGWVKSGNETEHRASHFLVGGRPYAIRLEFTKAKQGVDDSKKQTEKPPSLPASVALCWRRPQGAPEVIPARMLSTRSSAPEFVSTSPFPPDDRSYGWERGTAVSHEWDEATTSAAIEAVEFLDERLDELTHSRKGADDRASKLRDFSERFAERAFRQPLTDELRQKYVEDQFAATDDVETAVRRVVLLVLKSPRFLFRELGEVPIHPEAPTDEVVAQSFDVAARLAFGLWNSLPDEELLRAARAGRLTKRRDVRAQAERMLADVRAKAKLQQFLLTWLHLDAGADLTKDPQAFPAFDAATIADARTSLELFLDEVLASPDADYRQLILDDAVYLNDRLAKLYGKATDEGATFHKARLDGGRRAGVLTHPYVMARFAYSSESSPIHRGVFLARGVLGRTLRPPPNAFVPLAPDLHPDLTTRERVTLQTKNAECMACHGIINPLGFALEQFNAVGQFREQDRGKPVDATAAYQSPAGETVRLHGARQLAQYLANSDESHAAFVEQLFHHLVQQPIAAYGPGTLDRLVQRFDEEDDNIRQLAVEIMVATSLVGRDTVHLAAVKD